MIRTKQGVFTPSQVPEMFFRTNRPHISKLLSTNNLLRQLFLLSILLVMGCYLYGVRIITVGPEPQTPEDPIYDFSNLQSAIDSAITSTGIETEAIIQIYFVEIETTTNISIDFEASNLCKISIMGMVLNNRTSIVNNSLFSNHGIIEVIGNTDEDKEVTLTNLSLCHQGSNNTVKGIDVDKGLNKLIVDSCSFSSLNCGIHIQNTYPSSSEVKNIEITSCVFHEQQATGAGVNFSPFQIFLNGSSSNNPVIASCIIRNNTISGKPKTFGIVNFCDYSQNDTMDLVIENNQFITEEIGGTNRLLTIYDMDVSVNPDFNSSVHASNNLFVNGGVSISGLNGEICSNSFDAVLNISHNQLLLSSSLHTDNQLSIKRNTFWGTAPHAIYIMQGTDASSRSTFSIENNSFFNTGRALTISPDYPYTAGVELVTAFKNNFFACASIPLFVDCVNPIQLDPMIDVENCYFTSANDQLPDCPSFIINPNTNKAGDPLIAQDISNHTYELRWDYDIRSPLINTGTSLPDYRTDPDGTPPDIGAVYYPHFHKEYVFEGNHMFWMSFPVIDDRSYDAVYHWNWLGHLFQDHIDDPPYNQILSASWSFDGINRDMQYNYTTHLWDYPDELAIQPKGFKLKFNENTGEIDPITVNGFKVNPASTPIELTREITIGSNTYDFDNWIGYFVPYRQGAGTAFSRFVPGSLRETYLDHIYGIETQTWSTKRIDNQYGSGWIIDPNRYTLSEGDMVAIKLLPNAPEEMFWMSVSQAEPPRTKEAAINFSYKEELDYTPIFIEFDPEDTPEEVGLYVAGLCKGAAVVDSALIEVNYYASEAKDDAELEIMFYYGDKGMKKAPAAYVYNPDTMLFEAGSLNASNLGEYGYISFNRGEGSSLVPLVTELKQNYPNPFKGQTNISWILAKDASVSVDIYNLKGQKVKTLFSGTGVKGRQMAQWNGRDENNREVASGVYFYRLNTPEGVKVHKMMVLR